MHGTRTVAALSVAASLAFGLGTASAQEVTGRLPLRWAERPLTLTAGDLRIDGDLTYTVIPDFVFPGPPVTTISPDPIVLLALGAAYGVTDDLEVGALVLPILLSPDVEAGNPQLYGRYRFLDGDLEVGAEARVSLPLKRRTDLGLEFGVPLALHLGDTALFETGAFIQLVFSKPDTGKSLRLPARFSYNVTDNIFVGGRTGIVIPDFDFNLLGLPLGIFGGYTLAGDNGAPMLDVGLSFTWPLFINASGDAIVADIFIIGAFAAFYLDTET